MLRTYHRMIIDLEPEIPSPPGPTASSCGRSIPSGTHGSSRMRSTRRSPTSGATSGGLRRLGERVLGVPQFDPELILVVWDGADRRDGGRLPEAARRLGPDLAARRAARMAQAGAGAVAAPGELPPLHRAGETIAALGVDSENPTGATRLHERAGILILWRADVWRKELRSRCLSSSCRASRMLEESRRSSTTSALGSVGPRRPRPRRGPLARDAVHRSGVRYAARGRRTQACARLCGRGAGRRTVHRRRGSTSGRGTATPPRSSSFRVGRGPRRRTCRRRRACAVLRRRARGRAPGPSDRERATRSCAPRLRWSARSTAISRRPSGPPAWSPCVRRSATPRRSMPPPKRHSPTTGATKPGTFKSWTRTESRRRRGSDVSLWRIAWDGE